MSPERRSNLKREIPKGQELITLATGLAQKALVETYPQLKESPYRKRLIGGNIAFEPLETVTQRENDDKPIGDSILASALSLSGVNPEYIKRRWTRIANFNPCHQKSPGDTLYIVKEAFPGFNSPSTQDRVANAMALGDFSIVTSIAKAPTPRNLPPDDYKEISIKGLDNFLSYVEGEQQVNIDKSAFENARSMIKSLFDTNFRVTAVGASFHVMFDGQTFQTSDVIRGLNFSRIIAFMLARPAEAKFRSLMKAAGIINSDQYPTRTTINDRETEGILNSITGADFRNRDRLVAAYLGSVIPHYYIHSEPKRRIDPKRYPD